MPTIRTLCFDVYGTLVDPLRVSRRLGAQIGEPAGGVAELWRQKQLEYTFRLTAMGKYRDFEWVTRRALVFALRSAGHRLSPSQLDSVMAQYLDLETFREVREGLDRLAGAGHRLTVLSNGTPAMLDGVLRAAELAGRLDPVISVDEVGAFKPSPWVYEHAAVRLGTPIESLMLVSSNPFDVIGARSCGMEAAWLRRGAALFDELDVQPTLVVGGLLELAELLGR
jgi:2-haloacid dehalogenase